MLKYLQSIFISFSLLIAISEGGQASGEEFLFMNLPRGIQRYIVCEHLRDQSTIKAVNLVSKHTKALVNDRGVLNVNSFDITEDDVVRLLESVEPRKIQRVSIMSSASSMLAFIAELGRECHNVKAIKIHNSYDFRTMRKNQNQFSFDDNLVRGLLQNCKELTSLHVVHGHSPLIAGSCPFKIDLTDSTFETLSSSCSNIVDISLEAESVISSQAVLSMVSQCKKLTRINLNWTKSVDNETIKELVALRPTLELLNLQGTSVGQDGVREIADKCHSLTSLNICTSQIDNDTAIFVIRNCLELSYLKLCLLPESDSVFDALVLNSHKLHTLDVRGSRGLALPAVERLINGRDTLRSLNVDFTAITAQQISELHAIRPIMTSLHLDIPLPADFDADRYLELNPEIKNYLEETGANLQSGAKSHYLYHGRKLGCRYK